MSIPFLQTLEGGTFTQPVSIATSLSTPSTSFDLINTTATAVNFAKAATTLSIGAATGTTTINNALTVTGDLTVNGTTTTINATTLSVDDKNIELGSVSVPSDTTANGGGITLKGTSDKTFNWISSTSAWTSSENVDLASGKGYEIAGNSVLNATTLGSGVVNSSLTSVGTVATGTWNATAIADGKIASALTGKTYNGLSLTAQTVGFTLSGGTTSKTLTVPLDASVSGTNTGDQTLSGLGGIPSVLTDSHILVGNASNVATSVALSGDAILSNTGVISVNKTRLIVRNETVSTIPTTRVVYITGFNNYPLVGLADNTDEAKHNILGLTVGSIAPSSNGYIATSGQCDAETNAWPVGTELYFSTSGNVVTAEPTTGEVKHIGIVTVQQNYPAGKILIYSQYEGAIRGVGANAGILDRLGDSAGATKWSLRNYANTEVAGINSLGALTATSVNTSGAFSSVFIDNYIYRNSYTSSFGFYGGVDAQSSVFAYGNSHATKANYVEISTAGAVRLSINNAGAASFAGSVGMGALTATGGALSGSLAISYANPDLAAITMNATTTTNAVAFRLTNGGGNSYIGMSNSAGGRLFGGGAYSLSFGTESAAPLAFATNNILRFGISSAGAADFQGNSVSMGALTATMGNFSNIIKSTYVSANIGAILVDPGSSATGNPTIQIKSSYADGYNAQLRLTNTHTGGRDWFIRAGNNDSGGIGSGFQIYDNTALASRLLIDSTGAATFASSVSMGALTATSYNGYTPLSTVGVAADSSKLGGNLPAWYQQALGFTPVNKAGDSGLGTMTWGTDLAGAPLIQRAEAGYGNVVIVYRAGVYKWSLQDDGAGNAQFNSNLVLSVGAGVTSSYQLSQSGVVIWKIKNIATTGAFVIGSGAGDWLSIDKTTGAATFASSVSTGALTVASALGIDRRVINPGTNASPGEEPIAFGSADASGTYRAGMYVVNTFQSNGQAWLRFKTTPAAGTPATCLTLDPNGAATFASSVSTGALTATSGGITNNTAGTAIRVGTTDNANILNAGWTTGYSFVEAAGYNSPDLVLKTGGLERLRITNAGAATFASSVSMGALTATMGNFTGQLSQGAAVGAGYSVALFTNLAVGSYNANVSINDNAIIFSNGVSGQGNLVIGAWNGSGLVRIGAAGQVSMGALTASGGSSFQASTSAYGLLRVISTGIAGTEASIGFRTSVDTDVTSWVIGKNISGTDNFGFYYGGIKLSIASSGAATFAGSVQTTSLKVKQAAQINPASLSTTFYSGTTWENVSTGHAWSAGYSSYATWSLNFFDTATYTTPLVVTYLGNVGIGTTAPGARLDINVPNAYQDLLRFSNSDGGSGDIARFQYSSSGFVLNTVSNAAYARPFCIIGGNVGIGTTAPTSKLVVAGDALITGPVTYNASGVAISSESSMTLGAIGMRGPNTTTMGDLGFYVAKSDGSAGVTPIYIKGSTGNVGIGTTSPTSKLHVKSSPDTPTSTLQADVINGDGLQHYTSLAFIDNNAYATGCTSEIRSYSNLYNNWGSTLRFYTTGTSGAGLVERIRVQWDGYVLINNLAGSGNRAVYSDANGNLTNSSSDITLKTSIVTLENCLEKTLALRPVSFEWIDKQRFGYQTEIGMIAQEVQPIVPEVLGINNDGTKSIDYPKLVALLTGAVQEQQIQINDLKTQLATLIPPS